MLSYSLYFWLLSIWVIRWCSINICFYSLVFAHLGIFYCVHKSSVLGVVVSLCPDRHKSHFVSRARKIYININSQPNTREIFSKKKTLLCPMPRYVCVEVSSLCCKVCGCWWGAMFVFHKSFTVTLAWISSLQTRAKICGDRPKIWTQQADIFLLVPILFLSPFLSIEIIGFDAWNRDWFRTTQSKCLVWIWKILPFCKSW